MPKETFLAEGFVEQAGRQIKRAIAHVIDTVESRLYARVYMFDDGELQTIYGTDPWPPIDDQRKCVELYKASYSFWSSWDDEYSDEDRKAADEAERISETVNEAWNDSIEDDVRTKIEDFIRTI
jgi:hypothetical protein